MFGPRSPTSAFPSGIFRYSYEGLLEDAEADAIKRVHQVLTPVVSVDGQLLVMLIPQLAGIPASEFGAQ